MNFNSNSMWKVLDDASKRGIVEFLDVHSVGRMDTAMTSKIDREDWNRALKGLQSVAFSKWSHTSANGFAALRFCISRGIILEGISICIQEDAKASASANFRWLPDQGNLYEDVAVFLIESKSLEMNAVDSYGLNPLENASWCGHRLGVEALLAAGVDVNEKSGVRSGKMALLLAANNGHVQVVDALLEAGADVHVCDEEERTPLMLASKMGYFSVVQALLKAGAAATIDNTDCHGYTSLMNACDYGWPEIVGELIEAGADVNIVNERGVSALSLAQAYSNDKCAEIVRSAGASRGNFSL